MIPGDLLSAFPHRQFHTLSGLLDSWAALPNSYPNALRAMQGGSLYHFYDGLWYDPAERRTHDLPCERRTRYQLSQPDTVLSDRVQATYSSARPDISIEQSQGFQTVCCFYVQVIRQVALNNNPLRNGHGSQNFSKEPMFIFFLVKNDQKYPNEMIVCSGGRFWNFLQGLKAASLI